MKRFLIILLILGATTGYAQDTIHIPTKVAKQIVKELVSCDSLTAVHTLTTRQLMLTEQKVSAQDSIITVYKQKATDYVKQINAEQQKTTIWQDQYKILTKKYRKLKVNCIAVSVVLTGITGYVAYLYITK